MSVQMIWLSSLVLGSMAVAVVLLHLLLGYVGDRSRLKHQTRRRLLPDIIVEEKVRRGIDLGPIESLLLKAGIRLSPPRLLMLALLVLLLVGVTFVYRGVIEGGVVLFFLTVAGITFWRVKYEGLRRQILEHLPGIVDTVLRSLSVGRSLEQSLLLAFSEAPSVFEPLVFRLRSAITQGRDYTPILDDFAVLYQVPPVTQVAIALRTSSRFGSSVRPVLQEVAKAIRSRQELRREFMAATAETRFTAVVFALMPPAMAVYVVLANESFAAVLLDTPAGNTMIAVAGILQLLGSILIWNLIRGVGRG